MKAFFKFILYVYSYRPVISLNNVDYCGDDYLVNYRKKCKVILLVARILYLMIMFLFSNIFWTIALYIPYGLCVLYALMPRDFFKHLKQLD